jgi:hypothetical protein
LRETTSEFAKNGTKFGAKFARFDDFEGVNGEVWVNRQGK